MVKENHNKTQKSTMDKRKKKRKKKRVEQLNKVCT